jgi:hypothetical protein
MTHMGIRNNVPKPLLVAFLLSFAPDLSAAQNLLAPGQGWASSWNFGSVSDRSIALQRAQAIRSASNPVGPQTVVTTNNDNRSNFIENIMDGGTMTSTIQNGDIIDHLGDQIGNNTNSVGAMNTGTTEITITGDQNAVTATNAADNNGCTDASVNTSTQTLPGIGSLSVSGSQPNVVGAGDVGARSTSCQ